MVRRPLPTHAGAVGGAVGDHARAGLPRRARQAGGRRREGSTGGPDEAERAGSGSYVTALAYDAAGRELADVRLEGVDGYTFTGRFLAWAAEHAAAGEITGTGALGPVEAFGLERLEQGVAEAGSVAPATSD